MELDSRKKSRRNIMRRSKSFDTQEVKEIGRKEAVESRGFPIWWMGIIGDVLILPVLAPFSKPMFIAVVSNDKPIT